MNIICADRSWLNRMELRRILKKTAPGAKITGCKWPRDAVALAKAEGCDVLVTEIDFGKKRSTGFALAQEIKKIHPRVNIIFATAISEENCARELLQLRVSGYIPKPYEAHALEEEFQNLRYQVS